jgi:hypothetical protein
MPVRLDRRAALLLAAAALAAIADAQGIEQQLKQQLYTTIRQSPCVRLLKADGDIGCSSA